MRQLGTADDERGLIGWLAGRLDTGSGVPINLQLTEALDRAILHGQLRTGDSLPTVRELAGRLRIAPNTVSRALGELNRRGLTESRAGAGTVVIAGTTPQRARQEALRSELLDLLRELRQSGLSGTELRTLLADAAQELEAAI